jgi:hypothetical protein
MNNNILDIRIHVTLPIPNSKKVLIDCAVILEKNTSTNASISINIKKNEITANIFEYHFDLEYINDKIKHIIITAIYVTLEKISEELHNITNTDIPIIAIAVLKVLLNDNTF